IEGGGFSFYTNYRSRKARELEARGTACLVFMWSELERQVRIDGRVERVSATESDAYYASRPLGARLSAWASPQSERVASRAALRVQPLAGGVSSDIWRVDLADGTTAGPICVKRALPRLRVGQLWEAPIARNRYERQWLQTAGSIVAAAAPRVLAWDDEAGLF